MHDRNLSRRLWRERNAEHYRQSENARRKRKYDRDPEYRAKCVARVLESQKRRAAKVRAYKREWNRRKLAGDPMHAMRRALRRRVWVAFDKRGWTDRSKTGQMLGADWSTVATWIEQQFTEGMSWANHGKWHMDHIVPLASAASPTELETLFHYTNMRPAWALDNLSKGDRLIVLVSPWPRVAHG